ncbi:poly-beta-1,6-N-acetyl-D-glucosamine biosynthesis protein PgaD [Desulfotalea psychrophila]|uniref:poly-beta-1,6-N-acetyl-D-glucosamine biosynthesis protein PgaD n=1 Tax=Desulfotalea psychrophila TaxID=84980 RepID=UPI0002EDA13C|nr:poly-beta-1,6-N-acetyl-D-glucosamine biosynthesis protein PgaD [Desulfotalea psychrophila]
MNNILTPKELVVDTYQRQPRIYRWFALLFTGLCWLVWMILWFPVYTVVLKFLTGQTTLDLFFQNETNEIFFANALNYIIIIGVFFFIYLIWAQYNLRRYGKSERRQHTNSIIIEEEATFFHIDPSRAQEIRKNKEIFLYEEL